MVFHLRFPSKSDVSAMFGTDWKQLLHSQQLLQKCSESRRDKGEGKRNGEDNHILEEEARTEKCDGRED